MKLGLHSPVSKKLDSLGYPVSRGRDDLDMGAFLNIRLIRTASKVALLFQREALRPNGLSVQEWRVLLNVAKLGDCHLRELSRIATIDPSHVSRGAKALEQRGLIQRNPDPDDARRTRLSVTDEGTELVDKIWPLAIDLNRRFAEEIGEEALADLCDTLDRTRHYAEAQLGNGSDPQR
ncbi:MAG: MarR family winged helix-turn-helix transcriptional regulator [Paracoccaceae bacterium]